MEKKPGHITIVLKEDTTATELAFQNECLERKVFWWLTAEAASGYPEYGIQGKQEDLEYLDRKYGRK